MEFPAMVDGCALHRFGTGSPVICVPAWADTVESWQPLVAALSSYGHEVSVIELPGFGMAPPPALPVDIASAADRVVSVVRQCWGQPVFLVGHSLGSIVAVRAAHQLMDGCVALVSLEGNLTAEDAYFSGRTTRYDDAVTFKNDFCAAIHELVAAGCAPASYARAVQAADATCMWRLGRDVAARGSDDTFGREFRRLTIPRRYLWATSTTPAASRDYLREHELPNVRLTMEHHWPWTIDAHAVATEIAMVAGPRRGTPLD